MKPSNQTRFCLLPTAVVFTVLVFTILSTPPAYSQWEHVSPDGLDITVSNGAAWDANLLFAGTNGNGMFRYAFDVDSWTPLDFPDDDVTMPFSWIGTHGTYPDVVLVLYGDALFRSEDRGDSWQYSGLDDIALISLHTGGAAITDSSGQAYRYNPGSNEFDEIDTPEDAIAFNFSPTAQDSMWFGNDDGFWESTNGGTSWTEIQNEIWVMQIEVNEADPDIIWLLTTSYFAPFAEFYLYHPREGELVRHYFDFQLEMCTSPSGAAVMQTGNRWYLLSSNELDSIHTIEVAVDDSLWNQPTIDSSIGWIGGQDDHRVFAGSGHLLEQESDNPFEMIAPTDLPHANIYSLKAVPGHPDTCFAYGTAGLYRTINGGESWDHLLHSKIYNLVFGLEDDGLMFVATKNLLVKSTDYGDTWSRSSSEEREFPGLVQITIDPLHPNNAWLVDRNGRVYRTFDSGDSWNRQDLEFTPRWSSPILYDPSDSDRMYIFTEEQMYFSLDRGVEWTSTDAPANIGSINVMTEPSWRMIGTSHDTIYVKTTVAGEWQTMQNPPMSSETSHLAGLRVDPANPGLLWAVVRNEGLFWINLEAPIPRWMTFDIPSAESVTSFTFTSSDKFYLGSYRDGVWVLPDRTASFENPTSTSALPEQCELSQPWPNPFNSTVQLEFVLPTTESARVAVYDVQGRLVEELLSATLAAGEHRIAWQPDGVASGVYLVKLRAGNSSALRKVVYVK